MKKVISILLICLLGGCITINNYYTQPIKKDTVITINRDTTIIIYRDVPQMQYHIPKFIPLDDTVIRFWNGDTLKYPLWNKPIFVPCDFDYLRLIEVNH